MKTAFANQTNPIYGDVNICRLFTDGIVELPKECLLQHACRRCAFDQWLDDTESEGAAQKSSGCIG